MQSFREIQSSTSSDDTECQVEIENQDGDSGYFDIQSAEPGAFIEPFLFNNVTMTSQSLRELMWVFIKGDMMKGPIPGHPFEMPFGESTNFTLDLVTTDNSSHVVQSVMPPTTSKIFWGVGGTHTMGRIRLTNTSCTFYESMVMVFWWNVSANLDPKPLYQFRLSTDEPPSEHLSGVFHIQESTEESMAALLGSPKPQDGWRGTMDNISVDMKRCHAPFAVPILLLVVLALACLFRPKRRSSPCNRQKVLSYYIPVDSKAELV